MLIKVIFPATVLLIGTLDDLRSKKIHNSLILILAGCTFILAYSLNIVAYSLKITESLAQQQDGISGSVIFISFVWALLFILGKILLALIIAVPMVFLRIIGGGDMKLYATVAMLLPYGVIFYSMIYALLWAALLGIVKSVLDNKWRLLFANIFLLTRFQRPHPTSLNTFPFSVSLLMGWMTATMY